MKAFIVLVVLVIVGVWLAYQFGGFKTMDPVAEAEGMRIAVKPGMTWAPVVDLKAPRRYVPVDPKAFTGTRQEVKFDRAVLADTIQNDGFPFGFVFQYHFSQAAAFQVSFDGKGVVEAVEDMKTTKDLYEGRLSTE